MKNRKKVLLIVLVCLALAAAALCSWFFWLKDLVTLADATPVYVNSVSSIVGLDTGTNPRYSGIVEPQTTYKVEKDETRTVEEVLVSEGDEVHAGDPLFRYNTDEMQLSLAQAKLELEGIANQISTFKAQKAQLEKEKKTASKDDQYSYTVQIQSVETQIEYEEYNSSVKNAEIDKLEDSLKNNEVLSEVEGVIKEVNTTPKTDVSGQPLPFISILSNGEYRVKGIVTEMNRQSLSEGQDVTVHSRIDPTLQWSGKVESIDTEPASDNNSMMYYSGMDGGSAQSSKYYFYVVLESLEGLILGQHVYIEPALEEGEEQKTGLWLPAFYVDHDDNDSFVWIRNDREKLEKRIVILGKYDSSNETYEIKSGLTAKDYIAYPDDTLKNGLPVTTDPSAQLNNVTPPQGNTGEDVPAFDESGSLLEGGTVPAYGDDGETDPAYDEGAPLDGTDGTEASGYIDSTAGGMAR